MVSKYDFKVNDLVSVFIVYSNRKLINRFVDVRVECIDLIPISNEKRVVVNYDNECFVIPFDEVEILKSSLGLQLELFN